MKVGKKSYLLAVIFSFISVYFSLLQEGYIHSEYVLLSSLVIQVISFFAIFNNVNQPYSLFKVFYIFCLFFFGIAPLIQFYNNIAFWGARSLRESEYLFMNIMIIIIMIMFWILYNFFYKLKLSEKLLVKIHKYELSDIIGTKTSFLLVLFSAISFSCVLYANNFNLVSMLVRGGELKEFNIEGNVLTLMILRFIMPISVICFIIYYLSSKKSGFIFVVLLGLMLITASPTGISRNTAAGLYIPVVLSCFKIFKKRNVFIISFLFAILIIFPFLNEFRNFNNYSDLTFKPDFSMFSEGHFDTYANFALIINANIVSWGKQLLGVFLFWIPRSLWGQKPVASGIFLANHENLNFENISVNFFAEGYLNFGYVGIFIFLLALAFVLARIDKIHWSITFVDKNNFFNVIYLICLGMLFFVLRGDLMSSFAYTLGMVFSSIFVFKFTKNETH